MTLQTQPGRSKSARSRPAGEAPAAPSAPLRFPVTWLYRLLLVASSVILLSLAFAPFGQFYLAWVALVPWLMVVAGARRALHAFGWGWIAGAIYFAANLWYLGIVTVPGWIALSLYCALYWGLAAGLIRALGLLDCTQADGGRRLLLNALAVGAVWTTSEWLRGTVMTGLPFIYIGHTQTPFLAMCQVADIGGALVVSFWLAMVNAAIVLAWLHWRRRMILLPLAAGTAAILALVFGYGLLRMTQQATSPGPRIMVVQPNHLHFRGGEKPVTQQQQVEFHFSATRAALQRAGSPPDLIIWSETTMPPLNDEVRHETRHSASGAFLQQVHDDIAELARQNHSGVIAGGYYVGGFREVDGVRRATDVRNAAFFYDRTGEQAARYDKLHLVPFGEFIPFRVSLPWMFQLFMWLSPYEQEYTISAGPEDALTVMHLEGGDSAGEAWRIVTPICFEDLDAPLVAAMFRPENAGQGKRADILVNITNDGWFRFNAMAQHLQAAVFRSIENRVPTARSVNNGISGFIDSCGRIDWQEMVPASAQGARIARVDLDSRLSFYTRFGDVFSWGCAGVVVLLLASRLIRRNTADRR